MINLNMRCIEIPVSERNGAHGVQINLNMRCIEMMMLLLGNQSLD